MAGDATGQEVDEMAVVLVMVEEVDEMAVGGGGESAKEVAAGRGLAEGGTEVEAADKGSGVATLAEDALEVAVAAKVLTVVAEVVAVA